MYFESDKKTYYRFPSINSIHEMDLKYYFPEKSYASGEAIRYEANGNPESEEIMIHSMK